MSIDTYTRESVIEAVRKGEPLEGQKLKGIDLSNADLRNAKFKGSHFRYSDLRGADLRGSDLRGANLRHVNLTQANLSDADLREADLAHADIRGASFAGAKLRATKFESTRGLSVKAFFAQDTVDGLLSTGAELKGEELIIGSRNERWKLTSAVRVVGLEAGVDTKKVIGKLLPESELKALSIEIYRDTGMVTDGDTVYKLQVGFIGAPLHEITPAAEAKKDSDVTPHPVEAQEEKGKKSDQELINEFLLKRLTTS